MKNEDGLVKETAWIAHLEAGIDHYTPLKEKPKQQVKKHESKSKINRKHNNTRRTT